MPETLRYLREVPPEGRPSAAKLAEAWGYPRAIGSDEAQGSSWVAWGDDALAWYAPVEGFESILALHACASPDAHGRVGTARNLQALAVVGELLGAEHLAVALPATGSEALVLRRYLVRRGWSEGEHGCSLALGA